MFDGLFIVSFIGTVMQLIKETNERAIPAENFGDKTLYYKDIMDGIPIEQRMDNLANGKYKPTESYPKPHKDPLTGKIVIENCGLYRKDIQQYSAQQVMQWVKQGKYNLTAEEFKKEEERIRAKYAYLYSL
jgi:hypothetical protein